MDMIERVKNFRSLQKDFKKSVKALTVKRKKKRDKWSIVDRFNICPASKEYYKVLAEEVEEEYGREYGRKYLIEELEAQEAEERRHTRELLKGAIGFGVARVEEQVVDRLSLTEDQKKYVKGMYDFWRRAALGGYLLGCDEDGREYTIPSDRVENKEEKEEEFEVSDIWGD